MIASSPGSSSCTAFLVVLLLLAQQGIAQLPPVETLPALGKDLKPAFAGQTRIEGIVSKTAVTITPIVSGLVSPWGLDFFDDGRMIVSERPGNIRIVARDILQEPIQGVPPVLLKGDAGMYDVKLDPNFKKTQEMRTFAIINILKDTAIAGFALHIAASAHHQHLHYEEDD
jgi:glucose/arabinose dehydrogenase